MRATVMILALVATQLNAQERSDVPLRTALAEAAPSRSARPRSAVPPSAQPSDSHPDAGAAPTEAPLPPRLPFTLTGTDPADLQTAARSFPARSSGQHRGTTRYGAHIGMEFDGSGVAAGPASADYGLGVVAFKKNWLTSPVPGEGDGITIFGRNGIGDFAGTLCNVGTRQGFSACSEGVSSILAPGGGAPHIATRAIIASAYFDGTTYGGNGAVFYADVGTGTAAIDVTAKPGAAWADALQVRTSDTAPVRFSLSGDGMRAKLGAHPDATDVSLKLGADRASPGAAYIDLFGSAADATAGYGMRLGRAADTSYLISRTKQLTLDMLDAEGAVGVQVAGRNRLQVSGAGIGFNGKPALAAPKLAPPLPTDGSASNAQIAAAYNSLRAALIAYGLAQ